MNTNRARILVIEDEPCILRFTEDLLRDHFEVFAADNGEAGLQMALEIIPDLILVDNLMPKMQGTEVVRVVRGGPTTKHIPIVMLTALKEPVDRIEAYKAGVDDFISKPFHPEDLLTRVESKLTRFRSMAEKHSSSGQSLGNLKLHARNRTVEIDGLRVHMTRIEFGLIEVLIKNFNQVVSRRALVEMVWKDKPVDERILDIHMATLRKKTKAFNHRIETVYGEGYVIRGRQL